MPATTRTRDLGPDDQIRAGDHGNTRIHANWLPWGPGDSRWPHLPQYDGFVLLGVTEFCCQNDQQGELTFYVPVYQHVRFRECLEAAGVEMNRMGSHPACEFARLPPFGEDGRFLFGDAGAADDEGGPYPVHIVRPYLLGRTTVVQAVYEGIMGNNPSHHVGPLFPVEQVSWDDAQNFCRAAGLRLPSETEWEYGCRAGSTTAFCFGDNPERLAEFAWFADNSGGETHAVGELAHNAFGLFDCHGNVWEWCQDEWHDLREGIRDDGSAWGENEPAADPLAPWQRPVNVIIKHDGTAVPAPFGTVSRSPAAPAHPSPNPSHARATTESPLSPDAAAPISVSGQPEADESPDPTLSPSSLERDGHGKAASTTETPSSASRGTGASDAPAGAHSGSGEASERPLDQSSTPSAASRASHGLGALHSSGAQIAIGASASGSGGDADPMSGAALGTGLEPKATAEEPPTGSQQTVALGSSATAASEAREAEQRPDPTAPGSSADEASSTHTSTPSSGVIAGATPSRSPTINPGSEAPDDVWRGIEGPDPEISSVALLPEPEPEVPHVPFPLISDEQWEELAERGLGVTDILDGLASVTRGDSAEDSVDAMLAGRGRSYARDGWYDVGLRAAH